jgi:hypothetical protein
MTLLGTISKGKKLGRELVNSFDDKATNIPGRKTNSISVGKTRQKRANRKKKATEVIAGGAIVEALGIPKETLIQEKVDSRTNTSSKMKNTARDFTGTPAEKKRDSAAKKKDIDMGYETVALKHGGKASETLGSSKLTKEQEKKFIEAQADDHNKMLKLEENLKKMKKSDNIGMKAGGRLVSGNDGNSIVAGCYD